MFWINRVVIKATDWFGMENILTKVREIFLVGFESFEFLRNIFD